MNSSQRYTPEFKEEAVRQVIEHKDATQGAVLRAWLEQHVLPEFSARTLPIDTAVAQRCARLHVPHKQGERDAFIATTAPCVQACRW